MDKTTAITQFTHLAEQGRALEANYDSAGFTKWWHSARAAAAGIFGEDSRNIKELEDVRFSPMVFTETTPDQVFDETRNRGIATAIALLESMADEVGLYFDDEDDEEDDADDIAPPTQPTSREVFIVHGHDNEIKETVARFLTQLGLEPVILHERPNMGRTIIEKLEQNSKVGFAVVLLTADDVGNSKRVQDTLNPRARQNVILELGLFIGLLGRNRVCAMMNPEIEVPSDYSGVVYEAIDAAGAWKLTLVRELKASGFSIDANLAF